MKLDFILSRHCDHLKQGVVVQLLYNSLSQMFCDWSSPLTSKPLDRWPRDPSHLYWMLISFPTAPWTLYFLTSGGDGDAEQKISVRDMVQGVTQEDRQEARMKPQK